MKNGNRKRDALAVVLFAMLVACVFALASGCGGVEAPVERCDRHFVACVDRFGRHDVMCRDSYALCIEHALTRTSSVTTSTTGE